MKPVRTGAHTFLAMVAAAVGALAASAAPADDHGAFTTKQITTSTIPANGETNPYGVAFVPAGFPGGGTIAPGDVLAANFNGASGLQGTGTTIVSFTPGSGSVVSPGNATVFFTSQLPGLDTALGVLKAGFVIVGNLPTTDGTFNTISQGALQVIDRWGNLNQTWTDAALLDTPWDLAIDDDGFFAHIFVSNAKSGTVTRLDVVVTAKGPILIKKTRIGSGYTVQPSTAAVVLGPTGLAFDETSGTLYVASTADNAIYAIPNASFASGSAGRGHLVTADSHLIGPLALKLAPNGDLLTANGDATANQDPTHPSEIVEFTKFGQFVNEYNVDIGQGGAFGLDTVLSGPAPFNYAAIDDVVNTLTVSQLPVN